MTLPTFYDGEVLHAAQLNEIVTHMMALEDRLSELPQKWATDVVALSTAWTFYDFPAGRFTATPALVLTVNTGAGAAAVAGEIFTTSVNTGGFQARISDVAGGVTVPCRYIALQE